MAGFEELFSGVSSLGFTNPLMCFNKSESSLIKRILQGKLSGLANVSAASKLAEPHGPKFYTSGINKEDWTAIQLTHATVTRALQSKNQGEGEDWVPLAYMWEFFPCSAQTIRDWGQLVYTNTKLTKFLLVNNCGYDDNPSPQYVPIYYGDILKTLANKLYCIMKYLDAPEPEWVRASYLTRDSSLHPSFFGDMENPPSTPDVYPPIVHINKITFTPVLMSQDFILVKRLLSMSNGSLASISKGIEGREEAVRATGKALPWKAFGMEKKDRDLMMQHFFIECGGCRRLVKLPTLKKCGGRGMQQYCSTDCQKKQWKHHRWWCNAAQGKYNK